MKWVLLGCISLSLLLAGCVSSGGPWERDRYFEQAESICALYGDAIVPVVVTSDGISAGLGTAFFVDDKTGYLTARHVLEQLAPRASIGEKVRKISVTHQADQPRDLINDWVVFRMDAASTPAKGIRYDPLSRVAPGDVVYMAGYPILDRLGEVSSIEAIREVPLEIIPGRVTDLRAEGLESADRLQDYLVLEDPSESGRDYRGFSGGPVIVQDTETGQWKAIGLMRAGGSDAHDQHKLVHIFAIRPRIP